MIDLRSHILDGTPCGPPSFAESLEMCRAAISDGVKIIVATPQWGAGRAEPPIPFDVCDHKIERLQVETGGSLTIKLGFALRLSPDVPMLVERHGARLALAGKRHLLISIPSVGIPAEAEKVWQSLTRAGFSIVVSHPECNPAIRRDVGRLARWVADGLTLQIDAASVVGAHGREVARFALECLRKYEASAVVASNARPDNHRKGSLGKAQEELLSHIGTRPVRSLVREKPAQIIEDVMTCGGGRRPFSRDLTSRLFSVNALKAFMSGS